MSHPMQIDLVRFAIKYPKWQSYYANRLTTETVCATTNLGIIEVNQHGQFRLKSITKARQFLGVRS